MSTPRTRADACPGVLATHDAADGALARVRLPGGVVSAAQLRALAGCAQELGDGAAHLTSRGNLQLRGLDREDPRLVSRLAAAGLIPAAEHERVRNILASPLSGLTGGLADVRGLARALDEALCAVPGLAALPGRFLFALDDGRGDVAAERPDLCWLADTPDHGFLQVAGVATAIGCAPADAPALLVSAAEVFLTIRGDGEGGEGGRGAWRAAEVPGAAARIEAALPPGAPASGSDRPLPFPDDDHAPVGPIHRTDGGTALGVAPVLGELSAAQLRALATAAPEVIVTPWRTLVLPDPADDAWERLRANGFVLTADDPALAVSACAGRPGCAKSHADVRADVRAVLPLLTAARRAHVVGCERRCGAPHEEHLDLIALPDGTYRYRDELTDVVVPDLASALRGRDSRPSAVGTTATAAGPAGPDPSGSADPGPSGPSLFDDTRPSPTGAP
ncbi:precorrin-3B synthase [Pseudonocardia ailaonensis]|uniref:precorrin-3B synthase n=1 Tax=Pseudonocardia ailaonensis TaxID=367279 RepID=UPI0031E330AF